MTAGIDITTGQRKTLLTLLRRYIPGAEVWAYGSRVRWNARPNSDLDLVAFTTPAQRQQVSELKEALGESNIPFPVDLHVWDDVPERFHAIIRKEYVVLQKKEEKRVSVGVADGWSEVVLSEVIDIKHGFAFPGANIREEPPGDILLTPGNFAIGGGFKGDKLKYFDGPIPDDYVLHENDLIVTMTDLSKQADTLGYPALVPKPHGARFLHNQRLGKILIRPNAKLDKRFLFYLLRSTEYRNEILASATGTTVKHTSPNRILAHIATLPPLPEQKAIAHILGTLDDKIELNHRMNATLEAMARALFQSWFVDFDPVRRNADRTDDSGLTRRRGERGGKASLDLSPLRASAPPRDPNDALFPAQFQESPLGPIPEGWRTSSLGEIAKNVSATFDFTKISDVTFINTGDVLEGDFLHSKKIIQFGLPGQAKKSIRPDDILFSEIRPANKRFAYVDFNSSDYVVSTKFMVIRASKEILPRLLYRALTSSENLNEFQVQAESRSGTFPQITFDSICHLPIVLPPMEIQESYQRTVWDIDAQIKLNKHQSRTLAALRDTLLPKLLSGELSVANAEVHAEARRKKP